jgi:hypothetical protein
LRAGFQNGCCLGQLLECSYQITSSNDSRELSAVVDNECPCRRVSWGSCLANSDHVLI